MSSGDVPSITIFAPADVHSLEISGFMDAFHEANAAGAVPSYSLCVVAEGEDAIRCASGLRIVRDRTILGSSDPVPRQRLWHRFEVVIYDRYLEGGPEALQDRPSAPSRVWNRIESEVQDQIVEMALEQTDLSPRELAVRFTDEKC